MKKRILCVLLCCLLGISLAIPAVAAPEGPVITLQPQNYTYPEYSVALYTVKATGTNLRTTWYLSYEGKTYNLSDNTNGIEPWEAYAGETYGASADGFSWHFSGIEEGLNGAEIWCVIEDGHYDVTSDRAIITVQGDAMPPEITDIPAEVTVKKGETVDLRCIARSTDDSQLEHLWYETSTGKLQNIQAIFPEETGDFITPSTNEVGTRYYVCGITTSNGGRAYSSVVKVTVTEDTAQEVPEDTTAPTEETATPTAPTPTEVTEGTEATTEATEPLPQKDGNSGTPLWLLLLIALGAAGIGVGATLLIVKKKK